MIDATTSAAELASHTWYLRESARSIAKRLVKSTADSYILANLVHRLLAEMNGTDTDEAEAIVDAIRSKLLDDNESASELLKAVEALTGAKQEEADHA